MRVTVPDYYENFRCLAGKCPHTCCEKWEVVIDGDSAALYQTVPGPLGGKLRSALKRDEGVLEFRKNHFRLLQREVE